MAVSQKKLQLSTGIADKSNTIGKKHTKNDDVEYYYRWNTGFKC